MLEAARLRAEVWPHQLQRKSGGRVVVTARESVNAYNFVDGLSCGLRYFCCEFLVHYDEPCEFYDSLKHNRGRRNELRSFGSDHVVREHESVVLEIEVMKQQIGPRS